jgi:hypothetical protein
MQTNSHTDLAIDSTIAGGVITMPLWAVGLNEWLHLFMAIGGSILIAYRIFVLFKEIKNSK